LAKTVPKDRKKALERNSDYRKEKWGYALRADDDIILSNVSATRTEIIFPPTAIPQPPTSFELKNPGIRHYTPATPINIDLFEQDLTTYLNRALVEWAIAGLRYGVRTGYQGNCEGYEYVNLKSAQENTDVLRDIIARELAAGRLLGPFQSPPPFAKISPLGDSSEATL
jgi:hypothetical protein